MSCHVMSDIQSPTPHWDLILERIRKEEKKKESWKESKQEKEEGGGIGRK